MKNKIAFIKILLTVTTLCIFFAGCSNHLKPNKNGLIVHNQSIIKPMQEYSEKSAEKFSDKINFIIENHLDENFNAFYSIVPDKSYFINSQLETPFSYDEMQQVLKNNIKNAEYINIFNVLTLQDYYNTDIHWKQENLQPVLDTLGKEMGFSVDLSTFDKIEHNNYLGNYYDEKQAVPEKLYYLENKDTNEAKVENFEKPDKTFVYDIEKLQTKIAYDVYLSGASPLLKITNENAQTEKKLIIFRDSFTSSLAPLIISQYQEITLVDIRYIKTELLPDYVDFEGKDILFLYNTEIINKSAILK